MTETQTVNNIEQEPSLDVHLLNDVERYLYFEASYLGGGKSIASAEELILIYYELLEGNTTKTEIGKRYLTNHKAVSIASETVQRAIDFVSDQAIPEPHYARVIEISNAYNALPSFIDSQKENETELGFLFNENPQIEFILGYLSTGKSVAEYTSDMNISGLTRNNARSISNSLVLLLTKGIWDKRNLHTLGKMTMYRQFLDSNLDMNGCPVFERVGVNIIDILNSKDNNIQSEKSKIEFLYGVRNMLQLSVLAHYFKTNGKYFRGVENPHLIDVEEYYRCYFRSGQMPPALEIAMTTVIEGNELELYKFLASKIPYSISSIQKVFNSGYRFLENLLLSEPTNNIYSLDQLMRNRIQDGRRIMELMALEFARSQKS